MTNEVAQAIRSERDYQEAKWQGDRHTPAEWLLLLRKSLVDAERAWCAYGDAEAMHGIRQLTAVGVAAMEQCGAPVRIPPSRMP